MGYFRFHRSLGSKFLKLNVSKTGFSITSGMPGFHINTPLVGTRKRKSMMTLGLPGSGLSYRQSIGSSSRGSDLPFLSRIIIFIIGLSVVYALGALL